MAQSLWGQGCWGTAISSSDLCGLLSPSACVRPCEGLPGRARSSAVPSTYVVRVTPRLSPGPSQPSPRGQGGGAEGDSGGARGGFSKPERVALKSEDGFPGKILR